MSLTCNTISRYFANSSDTNTLITVQYQGRQYSGIYRICLPYRRDNVDQTIPLAHAQSTMVDGMYLDAQAQLMISYSHHDSKRQHQRY
jgi:hypothetical protein